MVVSKFLWWPIILSLNALVSSVEVEVAPLDSSKVLYEDQFSVQALIDAIAVPEALDLNSAIEMVSSPWAIPDDPKHLYQATIQTQHGNVPLLHHLFNLYQRFEQQPQARDAIGAIFVRLLGIGANPNSLHPLNREPSLVFKTVFMREVSLANALFEAGGHGQPRDPQPVLNLLLSIPCDLVPTTKLLLHADEMLKIPKFNESFSGMEGRRKFVASASRGPGSKPIPRSDDLFEVSRSYKSLVPQLGFIDSLKGMSIDPIISSLGDAVNIMLKNYLKTMLKQTQSLSSTQQSGSRNGLSDDLLSVDLSFIGLRGRNILHTAAAAGYAPVFTTLQEHYLTLENLKDLETQEQGTEAGGERVNYQHCEKLRQALFKALSLRDERGQTPVDVAKYRWGKMSRSHFLSHKEKLYAHNKKEQSQNRVEEAVDNFDLHQIISSSGKEEDERGRVVTAVNDLFKHVLPNDDLPNGVEETSIEKDINSDFGMYGMLDKPKEDMLHNKGGWDDSIWEGAQTSTSELDANREAVVEERCDALEVSASFAQTPGFSEWFFKNHMSKGIPLVIRQGVSEVVRRNFQKEKFVKRYGDHQVAVGVIPYGHSFGVSSEVRTLGQVANITSSEMGGGVNYAFTTPQDGADGWASKIAQDVPMPSWLKQILSRFRESGVEPQFYLGPKGSGAPVHFHGHAVNFLAYGLKEWVLSPPPSTSYSKATASSRYAAEHERKRENDNKDDDVSELSDPASNTRLRAEDEEYALDDDLTFRCTQHAGDVFYVPTLWGHGTFNHAQSIGTAFEISLESFCME